MGDMFSRCAPPGKFRVVSVDTFDADDWMEGDFPTIDEARAAAAVAAKQHSFMVAYVYDSEGRNVSEANEGEG